MLMQLNSDGKEFCGNPKMRRRISGSWSAKRIWLTKNLMLKIWSLDRSLIVSWRNFTCHLKIRFLEDWPLQDRCIMFYEDRNSRSKCPKLSDKVISRTTLTSEQMKMALMKIEASEVPNKTQVQAAPKILNGPKNSDVLMSEQTKCAKNTKV